MPKGEKKLLEFVERHIHILFAAAVLLIGCCLRIAGFHFLSDDARLYLLKWYDKIAEQGISKQVGNYNIPYQIIIWILTKLPLKPLHAYKVVSCAFDLGMALIGGLIVRTFAKNEREWKGVLAFSLLFCSPVVIMNSALWAQCDSIYAFFGVAALFLLYYEKYIPSFICLGIGFAFKLQTAFFLPFFLIYYVYRKKYSLLYFLIIPVSMVTLSIPGLLAGRNVTEIFQIYLQQTNTYNRVYVNFPNIYTLVTKMKGNGEYQMFRRAAILFTMLVLGTGLYTCIEKKPDFKKKKIFWGIVIWTLYSTVLFLPNMHERYGYVLEVISLLYCFLDPVCIPLALAVNLFPLINYSYYLFDYKALPLWSQSLCSLLVWLWFTCRLVGSFRDPESEKKQN